MAGRLSSIVSAFPPLGISSPSLSFCSRIGVDQGKYASFSLSVSLLLSALAAIVSAALSQGPLLPLGVFSLSFALSFFMLLGAPRYAFMRMVSQMEAELPFSLRMLGMLLELNVPFHEALSAISRGRSPLAAEFRSMEKELKRGAAVPSSLSHLAEVLHSLPIRRALLGVSSAYEKGKAGAELIRASDDLLSLQKHAMRNAASKQALISLVFIAVAVVLPAFLILFSSLGGLSPLPVLSPESIPFALLLLLPAISALLLSLSASLFPSSFFSPKVPASVFLPMLAALMVFVALQPFGVPRFPVFLILLAVGGALSYPLYLQERKREKLEDALPDAALSLSSQPPGRGLEPLLSSMAKYSVPPLSEELLISAKQARANVRQESVLEDLWRRSRSPILRRFSLFLGHALGAGHNISRYLALIAEDVLSALEMRRERESLLSMQKYTLIFGALLIPFIIGSTFTLSSQIASLNGSPPPSGIQATALSYLAIYAFLSSAFIAHAEAKGSSFAAYFALLSIAGMALFYIFSGISPV